MGGMLLMCQNTTITAGIWSTDQNILRFMFKTYSSSSSLVITSRWFATSRLAAPASVRLVYWKLIWHTVLVNSWALWLAFYICIKTDNRYWVNALGRKHPACRKHSHIRIPFIDVTWELCFCKSSETRLFINNNSLRLTTTQNTKTLHYWSFMRTNHRWSVVSPDALASNTESVAISWSHHVLMK